MTAILEFREVAFSYPSLGRRSGFTIRDLSFSVGAGEIFGVIGPNASGKTTLIRLLSRVLEPARGEIVLDGERLGRLSPAAVARKVAVVPQDAPAGFPYTVEDLVLMGRFPHASRRFFESHEDVREGGLAMAAAGVLDLRKETLDRLSGGERQRVMLARALCQRSSLFVLDEPTAHLDLRHQAECVELLRRCNREAGLTIILVSHDLNLVAEVCDRLLLLHAGTAVGVGPAEAVLEESTLASVYGCRVVGRQASDQPASYRPDRLAGPRGEVIRTAADTAVSRRCEGPEPREAGTSRRGRATVCGERRPVPFNGATVRDADGKVGRSRGSTSQETCSEATASYPSAQGGPRHEVVVLGDAGGAGLAGREPGAGRDGSGRGTRPPEGAPREQEAAAARTGRGDGDHGADAAGAGSARP